VAMIFFEGKGMYTAAYYPIFVLIVSRLICPLSQEIVNYNIPEKSIHQTFSFYKKYCLDPHTRFNGPPSGAPATKSSGSGK
jgi:hypothetical protein